MADENEDTGSEGQTGVLKIKATTGDGERVVEVTKDIGGTLAEAVAKYGEEVVYARYRQALVIEIQAIMRKNIGGENPKTDAEIQQLVDEHKPGVTTRTRRSTKDKIAELLEKLSPEERDAVLADLMEDEEEAA